MRTSRIQSVVNGTYARRFLQSKHDQPFMINDGGGRSFSGNPRQQQNNQKKNTAQNNHMPVVLNRNTKRMWMIGQPLDGKSMEQMRRRILEHQMKIRRARNKEVLIRTYRTSI